MQLVLAVALLVAVGTVVGALLAPRLSLATVVLYSLLVALALLAVVAVVTMVCLTFQQFLRRHGRPDAASSWPVSESAFGMMSLPNGRLGRDD